MSHPAYTPAYLALKRYRQLSEHEIAGHVGYGHTSAADIVSKTGKNHATVGMALKPFLEARLIETCRIDGRVYYRLNQGKLRAISEWLSSWKHVALPGEIFWGFAALKNYGTVYEACILGGTLETICKTTGFSRPAVHAALRELKYAKCVTTTEEKALFAGRMRRAFLAEPHWLLMAEDFNQKFAEKNN